MDRINTFKWYFIIFASIAIALWALTYLGRETINKKMDNYTINFTSPRVVIEECRVSEKRGYIRVAVGNNTGEHMDSARNRLCLL